MNNPVPGDFVELGDEHSITVIWDHDIDGRSIDYMRPGDIAIAITATHRRTMIITPRQVGYVNRSRLKAI